MTPQPQSNNPTVFQTMPVPPTPAQIKSRLMAWAEERDHKSESKGRWTPLGTVLRLGLPALAGFALLRLLIPSRGRTASGGRPGVFGVGLFRLAVLIRTGAWLIPLVAKAAARLGGRSVSR